MYYYANKNRIHYIIKKYNKKINSFLDSLLLSPTTKTIVDEKVTVTSNENANTNANKIKYEDKYWTELNKVSDKYIFTEEEVRQIEEIKMSLQDQDQVQDQVQDQDTNNTPNDEKTNDNILEEAETKIMNKRVEQLMNNIIMENTPLGNVLMYYNSKNEAFDYYSDNTIPYRYLETVGRKYVITYKCRYLYIDMNKMLEEYEKKQEDLQKQEELKNQQKQESEKLDNVTHLSHSSKSEKKNVFAKFKTYNKDSHMSYAAPPKNSVSIGNKMINTNTNTNNSNNNNTNNSNNTNTNNTNTNNSNKLLLKENANRYSYKGKIVNYNMLKKVDKKQVNKKYNTSFAEFKKMSSIQF
jgi:hypothetical protein